MKNNTTQAKGLIAQAIRAMPNDFTLSEVRFHLNEAYYAIQKVEGKRAKRENVSPPQSGFAKTSVISEQRTAPITGNWTPQQVLGVVNYIDKMIEEEKKKIEQLQVQRQKQEEPSDDVERMLQG